MNHQRFRVIAAIQTRMGSTRLPRKALRLILGKPLVQRIAERLSTCRELNGIALSTTKLPEDDALENLARRLGIPCIRGSETDLVSRLLLTARQLKADALVRITGDCPLVDSEIVDRLVRIYRKNPNIDYCTNVFPPTFPDGLDAEIYPLAALEKLDLEIEDPLHREWFPAYVMRRPKKFSILNLSNPRNLSHLRWTVDYPEDIRLVREIYKTLKSEKGRFLMKDVLQLLQKRPRLNRINLHRVDTHIHSGMRMGTYHQLVGASS